MGVFWSLLLVLVLTALGLSAFDASRPDQEARPQVLSGIQPLGWRSGQEVPTPLDRRDAQEEQTKSVTDPVIDDALSLEDQQTQAPSVVLDQPAQSKPSGEIVIDPDVLAKYADPDAATEQESQAETELVGSSFVIESDGSITIGAGAEEQRILGDGSDSSPFIVEWEILRGVQRDYDPRSGKRTLPGWLDALSGKTVRIEGNTLVPVVANQTKELLVMQNPWDGCCIGIPPTPYDAIEVSLSAPTTFGYSAVGYGTLVGRFVVDPYEVSGWLMGLFLIEDAIYTSGEGVALPGL